MTTTIIRRVISEVRPGEFPKITLLHGEMTEDEIAGLYIHPKISLICHRPFFLYKDD